ncbi:N-acetyl-gamma-glutamyl-phosphate reductase [Sphingomonas qomolangmaensis]|uniref:N-acetyl-gamma-glutamyl-phosphate reductase n=1 Tax=Sphingomonas qomolangmaensis TaxID=2918765 RepID=A0ABY5L8V7_9SPHN|nr:N-acetyl-gamma-glutamyl-phosphate reductase [Sphingomonas qomolangmaensis]UUL83410.1 N-acetyl-gamma-glutamyl-phosphate reductase [Sphingomonas qomolangmaensis]
MTHSVFIDGAVGTTGLEIRERLAGRTEFDVITLGGDARKDAAARAQALNDADFVILCLPDDAAREAVAMIANDRTRVIDASSAHRVAEGWTYGFAELEPAQAAAIAESARVSNPGCYPTGFLALIRPLVRTGLVPHDWPLSVNAVSGYSGGGKAMIADFESGEETTAHRAYGLDLSHKHLGEMQRHARIERAPIFQPAVAHTHRGMLVEVPLPLHALPRKPSLASIETALRDAYRDSPIVGLIDSEETRLVRIEEDAGTDRMTLRVFGNAELGQARLIATLDNLGKGAAGAAVQNLNIMAGIDATAGLRL